MTQTDTPTPRQDAELKPCVIKGRGFSDGGGFAEIVVNGKRYKPEQIVAALSPAPEDGEEGVPVKVTIFCPECATPHVDEGEWATTRHHKTHQCQACGHEWRPFPFATVGIAHPAALSSTRPAGGEVEPVAWQANDQGWKEINDPEWWQSQGYAVRALYASPQPARPTREEVEALNLLDGWGDNWIIARGKTRPDKPLYGAELMADDLVVSAGEGDTLLAAVKAAFDNGNLEPSDAVHPTDPATRSEGEGPSDDGGDDGHCDICGEPIKPDDLCLTDIELGPCHAECLDGSPAVNLNTGEPLPEDAPPPKPYRWGGDA